MYANDTWIYQFIEERKPPADIQSDNYYAIYSVIPYTSNSIILVVAGYPKTRAKSLRTKFKKSIMSIAKSIRRYI